jgi:hypothetical protein
MGGGGCNCLTREDGRLKMLPMDYGNLLTQEIFKFQISRVRKDILVAKFKNSNTRYRMGVMVKRPIDN